MDKDRNITRFDFIHAVRNCFCYSIDNFENGQFEKLFGNVICNSRMIGSKRLEISNKN